jgi:hypothetical protein
MPPETILRTETFVPGADDGLHDLVLRAARAVASDALDCGGLLEITAGGAEPVVRMEAALSDDGLQATIAKLDVHLTAPAVSGPVLADLVGEAVGAFGGTEYTNLCVAARESSRDGPVAAPARAPEARGRREDLLDVTVTSPFVMPLLAQNAALLGSGMDGDEQAALVAALRALGVAHRADASGLAVARHQLRRRMRAAAQGAALLAVVERGLGATLFTARIPPTQSLRVAVEPAAAPATGARVDVCISYGLVAVRATTPEEARSVQRFAERHFGARFGGAEWQVVSRSWASGAAGADERGRRVDERDATATSSPRA